MTDGKRSPAIDAKITRRRAAFWLALSPALLGSRLVGNGPQARVPATLDLPLKDGSLRFAAMGDTGQGDRGQMEMAAQMAKVHALFPFDLVIMLGDNIYGADGPADMQRKFETPYKPLLDAGVQFQATLGNHDNPNQRFYKPFNMGGKRYYTYRPANSNGVRFFALDSNYVDKVQLDWLEKELQASLSDWKIVYFHHPLYSSGATHGSALETRAVLEPLFVKYGVSAVFTGHDHIYERIKPQKGGIVYFVSGAGGALRRGDIRPSEMVAKGFDTDYHFMIMEISGDEMFFQAISRAGATVDRGVIRRPGAMEAVSAPAPGPSKAPAAQATPAAKVNAPAASPTPK